MVVPNDNSPSSDSDDTQVLEAEFDVIIYGTHSDDSYAAAQLAKQLCPGTELVKLNECNSGMVIDECHGKDVIVVGAAPLLDGHLLRGLDEAARRLIAVDPRHHRLSQQFDEHSAVVIDDAANGSSVAAVWHYFCGEDSLEEMPLLYQYAMQAFQKARPTLPRVQQVWAGLRSLGTSESEWDKQNREFHPVTMAQQGIGALRIHGRMVKGLADLAVPEIILEEETMAAPADILGVDVARRLVKDYPEISFGVAYSVDWMAYTVFYTLWRGAMSAEEFYKLFDHIADAKPINDHLIHIEVALPDDTSDIHASLSGTLGMTDSAEATTPKEKVEENQEEEVFVD